MDQNLESLFGPEEARVAREILDELQRETRDSVKKKIGEFRKKFEKLSRKEQRERRASAERLGRYRAQQRHHRVDCPSCKSVALVEGEPFGKESVTYQDGKMIVRQSVTPRKFHCSACGLSLMGYSELDAAGLGGFYTRETTYWPEEFHDLADLESLTYEELVDELRKREGVSVWNND